MIPSLSPGVLRRAWPTVPTQHTCAGWQLKSEDSRQKCFRMFQSTCFKTHLKCPLPRGARAYIT